MRTFYSTLSHGLVRNPAAVTEKVSEDIVKKCSSYVKFLKKESKAHTHLVRRL